MALSLNTNCMAQNTARHLGTHYSRFSTATRHLSSGLRINSAADDAAGLAIRELMRSEITVLNQGVRNANDAISLIQTADGALGIIDEKLIRMKELAEQASTGTYDSTQRLIIDSEFQTMAAEIDRIANATDFNGIKLLDGSLAGEHDGSGLNSTGQMKVHFGTGNDSAEDYYYLNIGDASLYGLGLSTGGGRAQRDSADFAPGGDRGWYHPGGRSTDIRCLWAEIGNGESTHFESGVWTAVIPKGTKNLRIHMDDHGITDSIQLFDMKGNHILGNQLGTGAWMQVGDMFPKDITSGDQIVDEYWRGFDKDAVYSDAHLHDGVALPFTPGTAGNVFTYSGMTIGYSGDGNRAPNGQAATAEERDEYLTIDETTDDLIFIVSGRYTFGLEAAWDYMPYYASREAEGGGDTLSIPTQNLAQRALGTLDGAIARKDSIRSHLGATQNRLENTITNLSIQAENLQASESRISDVNVSVEMSEFVRSQILTQAGVAMLSQANSMPRMLTNLLQG